MVMAGMDRATYCRASAAGADAWMAGKRRCLAERSHQNSLENYGLLGGSSQLAYTCIYIIVMAQWLYNDNGDIMMIYNGDIMVI
jgi:hypothetical protein